MQDERATSPKLKVYGIAIVVLFLISLVPLVAIAPFDRPSADDFSYSIQTHQAVLDTGGNFLAVLQAAINTSADYYQTWQGLYTSAFCLSLQPGIFGAEYYQIGVYFMLASIIFPCLYLAYSLQRGLFRIRRSRTWIPVGCILALLIIQCMPAINEAVYWYNGAANYTPWTCFCMLTAGLSVTALTSSNRQKRMRAILLASLLSFIISGSNYMPAFLNVMLMFGFACIGLYKRRPLQVLPLALAIVGFVISATAPGTAIRQSMFPDHPGPVSAVAHAGLETILNLRLFCGISLVLALVLVTPFLVSWCRNGKLDFSVKVLVAIVVLEFLAAVGMLSVPFYAMGGLGSGRIYNTAFELFAASVFVLYGYAIGCVLKNERARQAIDSASRRVGAGLAIVLAVACVAGIAFFGAPGGGYRAVAATYENHEASAEPQGMAHSTGVMALKELMSGDAAKYAAEYDAREAAILQAAGGVAQVREFTVKPETLFFSDIVGSSDNWAGAMSGYYGVQGIEVVEPNVENPSS